MQKITLVKMCSSFVVMMARNLLLHLQDNFILKKELSTRCMDTSQQNARVERKHRHILNVAHALRFHANVPIELWGECVLTAAYLINRTPTPLLNSKTPYEFLFGLKPSYDNLCIFSCLCYAKSQNQTNNKFASRS